MSYRCTLHCLPDHAGKGGEGVMVATPQKDTEQPPITGNKQQRRRKSISDPKIAELLSEQLDPKPEKRPRQPIPTPQSSQTSTLNHKNDHVTYHIERGLVQKKEYKVNEKTNQLMYQHQFEAPRSRGTGEIKLITDGLAEQAHEKITAALDSLGDACRDTFVAITALCIKKNSTSDMRSSFKVSVDEILDTCGKRRSNGSFNPEARAEVIKHIKTLSQTRIKFSMPTTRQVKQGRKLVWEDTEIVVEGPIISHNGRIGEYSSITGKELWEVQVIALGPWAEFTGGRIKTKLVPQQVLAYSPLHEPYHKKLGHYIHKLFRNNAQRTEGILPHGITMRALFEGAFIEPSRNRGEFKDDIDKALAHLKQDGVIGNYWYMAEKNSPEAYKKVADRQGRWFDAYLGLFINFSPPQTTLDHYKTLAKKGGKDALIDDEDEA
jgi:hypothetical protein